jgi:hypothetical protein
MQEQEAFHQNVEHTETKSTTPIATRKKQTVLVRESKDQDGFRKRLLGAYGLKEPKCFITGSSLVVEGAHLVAVADRGGYDVGNGIFLSVNWHRLMDKGILFLLL